MRVEHRGGIGADAEERGAGKVQHAGIAELDVQSERRNRVEQDGDEQQQHEMIFVEERRHHEGGNDRHDAEHLLPVGEASAYRGEPAQPIRDEHGDDRRNQQADNERLLFGSQQCDQIGGGQRHGDDARQQGILRVLPSFRHALRPAR